VLLDNAFSLIEGHPCREIRTSLKTGHCEGEERFLGRGAIGMTEKTKAKSGGINPPLHKKVPG
jgi:hypothetical protein